MFVSKQTNINLVISNEYSNIRYIRFSPGIFVVMKLTFQVMTVYWIIVDYRWIAITMVLIWIHSRRKHFSFGQTKFCIVVSGYAVAVHVAIT